MKLEKGYYLLLFVLLSSCLTNYHEFEIENFEEQLVVQALVNNRNNVEVLFSENAFITADLEVGENVPASIQLFEEGQFWDSLVWVEKYNDANVSGYFSSNKLMEQGKSYRLECSVEGFASITANTDLPPLTSFEILKVDTLLIQEDGWDESYLRLYVRVNMPENMSYYSLHIREDNFNSALMYSINDPIIGQWDYSIDADVPIFTNQLIPDKVYDFSIILNHPLSYFMNSNYIYIELLSLSEDMYFYLQSRTAAKNTDLRFNEPATVYSNIEGAWGIFAGYSVTSDTLFFSTGNI